MENKLKIEERILKELFVRRVYDEVKEEKLSFINFIEEQLLNQGYVEQSLEEINNILLELQNSGFIKIDNERKKKVYTLTGWGEKYALIKYITVNELEEHSKKIRERIDIKFFDYSKLIKVSDEKIKDLEQRNEKVNDIISDINQNLKESIDKIKEHEKNIKSFNNNIISIMSILIAAFSIIGFNIGGIKFLVENKSLVKPWEYAGCIAIINLSIVSSLYFLFYMIDKIINKDTSFTKQKNKSIFNKKLSSFICITMIVIVVLCFFIA
ncbi:hypothetical protein UT300019_06880 [Clostridium sp. CTA-19]